MTRRAFIDRCRRPTLKSWVGATLAVLLLLAECFAVTHPFDAAAHADGQRCTVCMSTTNLGAGATATVVPVSLDAATPLLVATPATVLVSIAPLRRFARGPPSASFAR
jgi:hypothetical protein